MQIPVFTKNSVLVIDKSKKPWSMDGRNGISYKAICHNKIEDEVQVDEIRITEDVYNAIEPMTRYTFDGIVDSKNGRLMFTEAHSIAGYNDPAKPVTGSGKSAK